MKKREFKEALYEVLNVHVESMDFDEKMVFVEKLLIDFQRDNEEKRDTSNKRKKWTDEELRVVLSDAPSKSNCLKYAKIFHRGYGSLEQIYRWAYTQQEDIDRKRGDDKFILQVKRIAKELGLRG